MIPHLPLLSASSHLHPRPDSFSRLWSRRAQRMREGSYHTNHELMTSPVGTEVWLTLRARTARRAPHQTPPSFSAICTPVPSERRIGFTLPAEKEPAEGSEGWKSFTSHFYFGLAYIAFRHSHLHLGTAQHLHASALHCLFEIPLGLHYTRRLDSPSRGRIGPTQDDHCICA